MIYALLGLVVGCILGCLICAFCIYRMLKNSPGNN